MNTWILLAFVAGLAIVALLLLLRREVRRSSIEIRRLSRLAAQRQNETVHSRAALVSVQKRLAAMEDKQRRMRARIGSTESALQKIAEKPPAQVSAGLSERVLESAIRQVREGARPASLVTHLGLSPVEAELIAKLHGNAH